VTVIGTALGQGVMGPNFGPVNNWWPWIFGGQGLWTSNQPTDPCNNNNQIWGAWGSWGQCDSTGSRWREAPCLVKESCPSLCQYDLLEKVNYAKILTIKKYKIMLRHHARHVHLYQLYMEHGVNTVPVTPVVINVIEFDNVYEDRVLNPY
jgi:hypothetical protein